MVRFQFRLISPLSDGAAGQVRAGDRMPWVAEADNFAPLASLDWQWHVHGESSRELRKVSEESELPLHVRPWTRDARRAGLARDAACQVRPDGHMGFACLSLDVEGLCAYLGRFGIKRRPASP